jgi:hypothetical protein
MGGGLRIVPTVCVCAIAELDGEGIPGTRCITVRSLNCCRFDVILRGHQIAEEEPQQIVLKNLTGHNPKSTTPFA